MSIASRHDGPGSTVLAPAGEHRIVVHASASTRTWCRETGKPYLRQWGDIDLVPSGYEGGFDADTAYQSLEIRFAPGVLDRVAAEVGCAGSGARLQMRHLLRNDRIVHLAQALDGDRRANSPGGALYADSIGVALGIELLGLTGSQTSRPNRLSNAQLKRVLDYIDAHLDHPLTIDVLSREAGASSSHLRTWFKVATGLTIHRYVLRRRVERARSLLLQDHLSTAEVAWSVGFAHQSHLARWMRRELGYTPASLRRSTTA